jgi:transposase-like protein
MEISDRVLFVDHNHNHNNKQPTLARSGRSKRPARGRAQDTEATVEDFGGDEQHSAEVAENAVLRLDENDPYSFEQAEINYMERSSRRNSIPMEQKLALIRKYRVEEEGRGGARAFAVAHGVNEQTFYNWLAKYDRLAAGIDADEPDAEFNESTGETSLQPRPQNYTPEERTRLVQAFKDEGSRKARAFALANGVNEQTFYNWVHKYEAAIEQQARMGTGDDDAAIAVDAQPRRPYLSANHHFQPVSKKIALVTQFKEEGGRDARAFAANHGVNEQTFYNWIHKFEKGELVTDNPDERRRKTVKKPPAKRLPGTVRSFTYAKKMEMIKLFRDGDVRDARTFAALQGINEQTFYSWLHAYDRGEMPEDVNPLQKKLLKSHFPEIENEMRRWVEAHSVWASTNFPEDPPLITHQTLVVKVRDLAQMLYAAEERPAFIKAPAQWIRGFLRRNNLGHKVDMNTGADTLTDAEIGEISAIAMANAPAAAARYVTPQAVDDIGDEPEMPASLITAAAHDVGAPNTDEAAEPFDDESRNKRRKRVH